MMGEMFHRVVGKDKTIYTLLNSSVKQVVEDYGFKSDLNPPKDDDVLNGGMLIYWQQDIHETVLRNAQKDGATYLSHALEVFADCLLALAIVMADTPPGADGASWMKDIVLGFKGETLPISDELWRHRLDLGGGSGEMVLLDMGDDKLNVLRGLLTGDREKSGEVEAKLQELLKGIINRTGQESNTTEPEMLTLRLRLGPEAPIFENDYVSYNQGKHTTKPKETEMEADQSQVGPSSALADSQQAPGTGHIDEPETDIAMGSPVPE